MRKQIGNPHRIVDVDLASRNVADVVGFGQDRRNRIPRAKCPVLYRTLMIKSRNLHSLE